ncbi:MAG: hypothetical protein Q8M92_08550, partial [Candidatus Subteraquimicrobiales bacterium]|nr:hypothetical protein [Candidatus Subteraquimicrobiales bacterium]
RSKTGQRSEQPVIFLDVLKNLTYTGASCKTLQTCHSRRAFEREFGVFQAKTISVPECLYRG